MVAVTYILSGPAITVDKITHDAWLVVVLIAASSFILGNHGVVVLAKSELAPMVREIDRGNAKLSNGLHVQVRTRR